MYLIKRKMYFFKSLNVFLQITKCISSNRKFADCGIVFAEKEAGCNYRPCTLSPTRIQSSILIATEEICPPPPLTPKSLKRARIGVFRSNGTEDEVFIGRVVRLILCQIMSDPFLQNAISQFQIVYFHIVKAFVQTEQCIG